jgi:hypothetical protein
MRTPVCPKYKNVSLKTNYHHVSLFRVPSEMYINSLKDDIYLSVSTVQRREFVSIVTVDLVMLHNWYLFLVLYRIYKYIVWQYSEFHNITTDGNSN